MVVEAEHRHRRVETGVIGPEKRQLRCLDSGLFILLHGVFQRLIDCQSHINSLEIMPKFFSFKPICRRPERRSAASAMAYCYFDGDAIGLGERRLSNSKTTLALALPKNASLSRSCHIQFGKSLSSMHWTTSWRPNIAAWLGLAFESGLHSFWKWGVTLFYIELKITWRAAVRAAASIKPEAIQRPGPFSRGSVS